MLSSRRAVLKTLAALPGLSLPSTLTMAQARDYPSSPIVSVGMFPPGTGADTIVRFYSNKLQSAIGGKPVVVETKVGMGGSFAAGYVAQAKPDGNTIFMSSSSVLAAAPWLFKSLPYNPKTDFAPVATLFKSTFVLVVPSGSQHKTVAELTAYLKEKGDRASYGSATHPGKIASEMYKTQRGLRAVEVPYKSGLDAMNDLNGGHIDFYITDSGTVRSHINPGGRLRALMTTSQERFAALPDVPSAKESGLDIDLIAYWALYVPAKTPQVLIDRLASWMAPIVTQDDTRQFLANLGFDPWIGSVDAVDEMIERESRLWSEYVKIASIERQ